MQVEPKSPNSKYGKAPELLRWEVKCRWVGIFKNREPEDIDQLVGGNLPKQCPPCGAKSAHSTLRQRGIGSSQSARPAVAEKVLLHKFGAP